MIGESGCGKVSASAIIQLLELARIESGEIIFMTVKKVISE